jgi:hypothetical protein
VNTGGKKHKEEYRNPSTVSNVIGGVEIKLNVSAIQYARKRLQEDKKNSGRKGEGYYLSFTTHDCLMDLSYFVSGKSAGSYGKETGNSPRRYL